MSPPAGDSSRRPVCAAGRRQLQGAALPERDPAGRRLNGPGAVAASRPGHDQARAAAADLPTSTYCHTFRVTGITVDLSNGGTLDRARATDRRAARGGACYPDRATLIFLPRLSEVSLTMSQERIFAEPVTDFEGDFERIAARIQSDVDTRGIVRALTAAIVAQEITRITVTKSKMDIGQRSDVDKSQLIAHWRVLSDHYERSKPGKALIEGVAHLERLTPEEATDVVYEIRRMVKPKLDREMEEEELRLHFEIPLLGKLRWTARGPRVAIRKFRTRLLKRMIESIILASVLLGAVHWLTWMILDRPYLVQHFGGIAKVVQFILLFLTALIVWALWIAKRRTWPRTAILCGGWSIVTIGAAHWVMWVVLGRVVGDGVIVEGVKKIGLLVFVLSGGIACWIVRRMLRTADGVEHDAARVQ